MRKATLLVLLLGSGVAAGADDPCLAFKWDLSRERALFASPARAVVDGNASPPATIDVGAAVDLELRPQASVNFLVPPSKPMLTEGAWAGLASFRVTSPGIYRIALNAPFWIDVLANSGPLTSIDFGGPGGKCPAPIKVVTYELPAGEPLVLQLSGATERQVRVTITRVP